MCPRKRLSRSSRRRYAKVVIAFPFLAGKITNERSGAGNAGLFRVAPCPEFDGTLVRKIKDCEELCPSYEDIMATRGTFRTLDGFILTEQTTFPLSYQEDEANPAPLIAVQVNLDKGGILVHWCTQHNIMDSGGLSRAMKLVATAVRGEEFHEVALVEGSRDRRNIIPFLGPDEPMMDHSYLRKCDNPPLSSFEWRDYRITGAGLKALHQTKRSLTLPSSSSQATTPLAPSAGSKSGRGACQQAQQKGRCHRQDWQVARHSRHPQCSPRVHGPQHLHLSLVAASRRDRQQVPVLRRLCTAQELVRGNKGVLVRNFATLISSTPDKSTVMSAGRFDPERDFGVSSDTTLQYRYDYGILGTRTLQSAHCLAG
ncbi:hypothetical protein BKA65DRAFT_142318 [Rhexocercosporidium sp. MPI-PUGE-AT-0058]|nr:hypothetical protein BKA65DRAFT_142318 [Rhexocercosporidium sp. MPI-PUGE-AT-0058]